ncbi:MAG: methyltransferase domain-containing protein [Reichenbachiella sp.]|uniref:class I SAM-dependent methyltransferase n=1 Tax=Reichenbachiella sp. TaxID=2184521 RepID=UPI00329868B2
MSKKHYDDHLADFYSWMVGDFLEKKEEFQKFLETNNIYPSNTKVAIDLGAGHGIQSVALLGSGFDVTAIDFSDQLLKELSTNSEGQVATIAADIRSIKEYGRLNPELIICCGDTITHLESKSEVTQLIADCEQILVAGGKLILSFRDYSSELADHQRFIPVKSDASRILTCILEYGKEKVKVTDLLYEKTGDQWNQKVSSYEKVRVNPVEVVEAIENCGMSILFNEPINRMQTIVAKKTTNS